MKGLMLDTPKSGPATREVVCNKKLIPEATRTYQPLPNRLLLDMIYRIAKESKVKLKNEQLGTDQLGQRMFGVCDIEGKDFLDNNISMMIGFCNSYNGTMSTRFCIGGKVFVCSNRVFHAYTDEKTGISGVTKRPHWHYKNDERDSDNHAGLIIQIREAFQQIDDFREAQENFYGGLLNRRINSNKAYATCVRAAQKGIIKPTKVLTVCDEWDRQRNEPIEAPEFEWHSEFQDRNAYSLFNAFTQVEKTRLAVNPVMSNISTLSLSGFFSEEFNLN